MGAVWMRARAELRARWRALVVIALLIGVVGGGALAAAAGARRTMSAYPRFLERHRGGDATVNTGRHPQTDRIFDAIGRLPSVEATARAAIFIGRVRTSEGRELEFPDAFFAAELSRNASFEHGYKILEGAEPEPDATDQVMANYYMAERLGLRAGDVLEVTVQTPPWETSVPYRERSGTYRLTGVYAVAGQFEAFTESGFPETFTFPPAFARRHEAFHDGREDDLAIRLRGGTESFDSLVRDLERATIQIDGRSYRLSELTDGPPRSTTNFTESVQALNRMPALTLALLAAFLAFAIGVVASQSLGRESSLHHDDIPTLRALGMSATARAGVDFVRAGIVATASAVCSIAIAIAASPLTPVGVASVAEPAPGFTADLSVLGLGSLVLLAIVLVGTGPAALRSARRGTTRSGSRSSVIADRLSRGGASPAAVTGVRMALHAGSGRSAVPVRTTALGVAAAIATVLAAIGFRVSMDRVRTDPVLSGYRYDAAVLPAFFGDVDHALLDTFVERTRERPEVLDAWRGVFFNSGVRVGDLDLPAVSYEGVSPVIAAGRAPLDADEIGLDARTMRLLHVGVGDAVEVGTSPFVSDPVAPREMRVVGRLVPPRLPFIGAGSGQGVALTKEGLESLASSWDAVYLRFVPGVDVEAGVTGLRHRLRGRDVFAVVSRTQGVSARSVASIAVVPAILAAALGVLAVATLVHTMLLTVRRRSRDLAVLKTIGFVGRQVRATVAWQSSALVTFALLLGIPAGIVLGRWAWRLFADQIEVVPLPIMPASLVAFVLVTSLVVGNLIAALPARAAARTKPAVILRTE